MRGANFAIAAGLMMCLGAASSALAQDCGPNWEPPFAVDPALYPFEHHCIKTAGGVIHYVDERATPEPRGTVLLVHGNPSWSFLYREVIAGLRAHGYRTIAPDLLGFGMSSKPDPNSFPYSPRSQAENLAQFIEALDLNEVTLVIHDWGGPIGLHAAGVSPERIDSLVVLNTWGWTLHESDRPLFHFLFDWVNYNVSNAEELLRTGSLPKSVGQSVAGLYGPPGSQPYLAVRNAYWGPFLNVSTGLPLSEDAIQPTNRLYHYIGLDPAFMEEVELAVQQLSDRPVAFVMCADDKWFGALRCNANANPTCPPPLECRRIDGIDWCVDAQGQRVYPALDRWVGLWSGQSVQRVDLRPGGGHFTAEYEAEAIVNAVLGLHVPVRNAMSER
ncbi:MAG: alpha/beta fold hydrolase [Phycisphaerales bacterium]|nr:alpha/beta fold hydrolase [Phycisphaerales bacterium]